MNLPAHTDLPKQYDVYPFIESSRFEAKLKGKNVVLTGASSGIGRDAALAFAAAGANVACVARRKDRLDALVEEIKQKHKVSAVAVPADLSDTKVAKDVIAEAEKALGPTDILVNNAGLQLVYKFEDVRDFDQDWWRVMTINFQAPAALTHAVLPSMRNKKAGVLINIASTAGAHDSPGTSAYSVSKAAMMKLYQSLMFELVDTEILTFNVHPGTILTDMVTDAFKDAETRYGGQLPDTAEWKWQTTQLAANTLVALCADERCKKLNGRYIDSEQDLEKVLEAAESGRLEKERLYWLKVDEV